MTRTQRTRFAKPTAEAHGAPDRRPKNKTRKSSQFATGDTILIAGLGNPGSQYAGHRHNIGFMALDHAAGPLGAGPWRQKFQGEIAEARHGGKRIVMLKPLTFMNESGRSVGEVVRFLKIPPEDVIVFHDELDLAPGKVRVKTGGGHAGHNGLRSIHAHIGPNYARVRLGIGHPGDKRLVSGYVLHDFAKADEDWIAKVLNGISDGLPKLIQGDDAGFLNAVSSKSNPPRPSSGTRAPHQARIAQKKSTEAKTRVEKVLEKASPNNPLARLLSKFSKS
ncbi:MAG: aminoacyl-tRNA hydrolase [Pseudomonadota bacterium]